MPSPEEIKRMNEVMKMQSQRDKSIKERINGLLKGYGMALAITNLHDEVREQSTKDFIALFKEIVPERKFVCDENNGLCCDEDTWREETGFNNCRTEILNRLEGKP